MDKELELFKIEIQSKLEAYRLDLQFKNSEHQKKYSKLHKDMAETIKNLYKNVTQMDQSMRLVFSTIRFEGDKPKMQNWLVSNLMKLWSFLVIINFFNDRTCEIMDSIKGEIQSIWHGFTKISSIPEFRKEQVEIWKRCSNVMKRDISSLKVDLETEFRSLLGVVNKLQTSQLNETDEWQNGSVRDLWFVPFFRA